MGVCMIVLTVKNMIIPLPTPGEPKLDTVFTQSKSIGDGNWIKWYLDCPNWKCACGVTNFGRNKNCARDVCRVARPTWYVENEYESGRTRNI
jgi:hypothetical protein